MKKFFARVLVALMVAAWAVPFYSAPASATALSITAANVVAAADAVTEVGTLGATVTSGQVIYKDTSDGTWKLADNNSATAAARTPWGIALNGGGSGQPVKILKSGSVTIGATVTAGVAYYLGANAGEIVPVGDLSSGMYPTVLGIATSASVLKVNITASGVSL